MVGLVEWGHGLGRIRGGWRGVVGGLGDRRHCRRVQ